MNDIWGMQMFGMVTLQDWLPEDHLAHVISDVVAQLDFSQITAKYEGEQLLQRAQAVDQEEARNYGEDRRGDELPRELAIRERRLKKIRTAQSALVAEAQAQGQ